MDDTIAKQNIHFINCNRYAEVPIPDFVDIILKGNDEAMYYLLHNRLNRQLYERYETDRHQLYDDFEDIIEDFFLYLHEHGRGPYQSLKLSKTTMPLRLGCLSPSATISVTALKRRVEFTPSTAQTTSRHRHNNRSLLMSRCLPSHRS